LSDKALRFEGGKKERNEEIKKRTKEQEKYGSKTHNQNQEQNNQDGQTDQRKGDQVILSGMRGLGLQRGRKL
jgi:hypothetical protein